MTRGQGIGTLEERRMKAPDERDVSRERAVSSKLQMAASLVVSGEVEPVERLVRAWPFLRPLFPNTCPGQAGLSDSQKRDLNWILDAMGGARGAGANGPTIRRLREPEADQVAIRIRHLASSLSRGPEDGGRSSEGREAPATSVTR